MPRRPRLQYEGAFYHVFSRGNRRSRIFRDDWDYREFEEFLLDQACRNGICLYAWCLMPNHFHLLVETPGANLAVFMQRLLTAYARYFNRRHGLVGHLFQNRYQARHCDQETYLLELVRYIHLNPYRAKRLTVPEEGWPWSSHRYYVGGQEPAAIAPYVQAVLQRFSDDLSKARVLYEAFVAEGLAQGTWDRFYQLKGRYFLGSERFVEDVRAKAKEPLRLETRLPKRDLEELLQIAEQSLGVSAEALRSKNRTTVISAARRAFVHVARDLWRYPSTTLARFLHKDVSAISQILRRAPLHGEETERLKKALAAPVS